MITVQEANYEGGHRIKIRFGSGEVHVVDLSEIIARYPAARTLRDEAEFSRFFLDEWPTLAWPCGFDLSPETLYELATGTPPVWLQDAQAAA
jgi:hypothetical protein